MFENNKIIHFLLSSSPMASSTDKQALNRARLRTGKCHGLAGLVCFNSPPMEGYDEFTVCMLKDIYDVPAMIRPDIKLYGHNRAKTYPMGFFTATRHRYPAKVKIFSRIEKG